MAHILRSIIVKCFTVVQSQLRKYNSRSSHSISLIWIISLVTESLIIARDGRHLPLDSTYSSHSELHVGEQLASKDVFSDIVIDDGVHTQLLYPAAHVIVGAVSVQLLSLFHIIHVDDSARIEDTVLALLNVHVRVLENTA